MPKPFYLTTPIYYVNDRPHIGHVYTTVLADAIARFHRQMGETTYFLTGTDEHGQKVEKAAAARGIAPKALADEVVANYTDLWKRMDMTHDRFIRTTDADHREMVQTWFQKLVATGDIYKATYKGLYSVSDEAFVTEIQAKELQAQGLAHQLVELEEETYNFRLSKYEKPLLEWYEKHPDFVQPDFRFNEVKRFVEGGLLDLSISRTTIAWGIPVPGDEQHVVYVWFDALLNYLTGAPEEVWPPDLQIVGKDILRFHAVYWPAFLMAMDLPLPKTILAHGWWLMGSDKMSKSKGNIVRPDTLLKYGNDALRYYFLRDMRIGYDRDFAYAGFIDRLNADLANGVGNLSSRTLSMIQKYRGGRIPTPSSPKPEPLRDILGPEGGIEPIKREPYFGRCVGYMKENNFTDALSVLFQLFGELDALIVKEQPWVLAKHENEDPTAGTQLDALLEHLWRVLMQSSIVLAPVMPELAQNLWSQLGMSGLVSDQRIDQFQWGRKPPTQIGTVAPLFARIDKEKEMSEFEAANAASVPVAPSLDIPEIRETVDADTFFKVDLRVGKILEAERVPKSDKLIKMKVDIGLEQRTVVGGIGKAYEPDQLLNRLVVVVANLAPRKLMGIESHGMLLAASDSGSKPYLIAPPVDALPGFIVK